MYEVHLLTNDTIKLEARTFISGEGSLTFVDGDNNAVAYFNKDAIKYFTKS